MHYFCNCCNFFIPNRAILFIFDFCLICAFKKVNNMSISKINFTSSNYIDVPSWVNDKNKPKARTYTLRYNSRPLQYDEFEISNKPRSRKKQKTYSKARVIALLMAAGLLSQTPKLNNFFDNKSDIVTVEDDSKNENNPVICIETEAPEEISKEAIEETIESKENIQAARLLDNIKNSDIHAPERLEKLTNALNLDELEVADFLIHLCESEKWGNNCIDPLLFYAQICQESNAEFDALGDYSKRTGEYLAFGYGQFHECAVDEVNNQIEKGFFGEYLYNNGQKYTYEDRINPKKALEMMILLLRYDASKTDSKDAMLAMYNQGHKNGINTQQGQEYVDAVYSQIGY